jgi:hypothetical protein
LSRDLRSRLIRLAASRPELRAHLLPLLVPQDTPATPQIPVPATPVPQQPQPVQVMQPVAPAQPMPMGNGFMQPVIVQAPVPPAPVVVVPGMAPAQPTFTGPPPSVLDDQSENEVFVTARAQHGFNVDLAPEMDRMLSLGLSREQVADWALKRLRDAFRTKDNLYMILIRYQSTFESDEKFRTILERAIDIWKQTGGVSASTGG